MSAPCPVCGRDMGTKILVCEQCWWEVPTKDRVMFHRMWAKRQNLLTKGQKISRGLREKHLAKNPPAASVGPPDGSAQA